MLTLLLILMSTSLAQESREVELIQLQQGTCWFSDQWEEEQVLSFIHFDRKKSLRMRNQEWALVTLGLEKLGPKGISFKVDSLHFHCHSAGMELALILGHGRENSCLYLNPFDLSEILQWTQYGQGKCSGIQLGEIIVFNLNPQQQQSLDQLEITIIENQEGVARLRLPHRYFFKEKELVEELKNLGIKAELGQKLGPQGQGLLWRLPLGLQERFLQISH